MFLRSISFIFGVLVGINLHCEAQASPLTPSVSLDTWKSDQPPFYFKYDGKESSQFLSTWQRSEETALSDGGELHRYIFSDPATKLKVTAEVRTFRNYPAMDWVLYFTNEGAADTPIIEDIQPLHWSMPVNSQVVLHSALGSTASRDDFQPRETALDDDRAVDFFASDGRSSNNCLPFFNLQEGDHGIIEAIGWTGDWFAHFAANSKLKTVDLTGGMRKAHFLLHAGEMVRTPRIVLLDWQGSPDNSQNLWRRFVLDYYSPRDLKGHTVTVPISLGTWGTESIDFKLKTIKEMNDEKIPYDVYWVDAGWYGDLSVPAGATTNVASNWASERGSWTPSPTLYPDGLKPLGDAVKASGHRFLLWIESETADKGSMLRTQHPDWFMRAERDGSAILNLANPEARKGITDLVSNLITDAGMDWYRQDSNVPLEGSWASLDTPDRVGIEEINYVTGLYTFWDELRARHPGLQIDNCASGGRRLDIETMSRSVALWRTDYTCNPTDPSGNQMLTQALNIWVPLNAGKYGGTAPGTSTDGPSLAYAIRSSYSTGWVFGPRAFPLDIMKSAADEFDQVRSFFQGDMYPLTPYSGDLSTWSIIQWDRPDLKAGIVMVLRRQNSSYLSVEPGLHAIDSAAYYQVEIRKGFERGEVKTMSGKELIDLQVSLPEKPASALIVYQEQ